jgi:hypothetical protein
MIKEAIIRTLIAITSFSLAAMLGQLDIILANWYGNPNNTWQFPLLPLLPAIYAWELIYGVIAITFFITIFALSLRDKNE